MPRYYQFNYVSNTLTRNGRFFASATSDDWNPSVGVHNAGNDVFFTFSSVSGTGTTFFPQVRVVGCQVNVGDCDASLGTATRTVDLTHNDEDGGGTKPDVTVIDWESLADPTTQPGGDEEAERDARLVLLGRRDAEHAQERHRRRQHHRRHRHLPADEEQQQRGAEGEVALDQLVVVREVALAGGDDGDRDDPRRRDADDDADRRPPRRYDRRGGAHGHQVTRCG